MIIMNVRKICWEDVEKESLGKDKARKVLHTENMTIARVYLDKGSSVPEHKHENEQISWVIRGSIEVKINDQIFNLKSDESLVIPPDVPHFVRALEETEVMDSFSPPRKDWETGQDSYLR